ncbi:MAG: ubiquinol-cytochrome c reductase iron-sulfur subunit [uncultured bacterium]|nr:MAG: ubiquinol-cytochrome c reductase iron-sulfur subunit [uncultured bacterium]OGT32891.1 MAG: ubiquinol-cytochrome c reductase iron-sulfur subunit [Gammaproteobacteria bacterium RIFCSPHIGHO2_02_FULL_39_13]OGT50549.1 MAG: ubiquinol-cytochrome c reductase iron-sulfur subunit [Gammaproteobacteria bacterium RIFCSPHIGHO2_12_FULL_39_24]
MSHQDDEIDQKRREFLTGATVAMGAIGVAAACVPFISSLLPGAAEIAAGGPVRVKVKDMKLGDQLTVMWRGKPVWIIARGDAALASLNTDTNLLRDPNSTVDQQPEYAKNIFRSRKPLHLILVGVCTHLGCTPTYRPDPHSVSADWPGGFFCSCHGSKFDLAGRVFKNVPAPINLEVPPYVYLSDDEIMIGVNKV